MGRARRRGPRSDVPCAYNTSRQKAFERAQEMKKNQVFRVCICCRDGRAVTSSVLLPRRSQCKPERADPLQMYSFHVASLWIERWVSVLLLFASVFSSRLPEAWRWKNGLLRGAFVVHDNKCLPQHPDGQETRLVYCGSLPSPRLSCRGVQLKFPYFTTTSYEPLLHESPQRTVPAKLNCDCELRGLGRTWAE